LYEAVGSKTMRESGILKAITDDALLFNLVIIAKLFYSSGKRRRKTGVNYENRIVTRNVGVLAAQP
jgi:hypothetical protein